MVWVSRFMFLLMVSVASGSIIVELNDEESTLDQVRSQIEGIDGASVVRQFEYGTFRAFFVYDTRNQKARVRTHQISSPSRLILILSSTIFYPARTSDFSPRLSPRAHFIITKTRKHPYLLLLFCSLSIHGFSVFCG